MQKISFVKNKFSLQNINVANDWFQGCMEHFIDENPSITENELFDLAMSQWLLTDLNDMECKCFPEEVLETQFFQLNGKFPVQMNHILDISESAYEQYRHFFGKAIDEVIENTQFTTTVKKKRMLRLELSDGAKTVMAMEVSIIPILNTKLNPGCKFMLSGPIRCINKVLLLDKNNIKLLGGEVEEWLIDNAYENVLRKIIGLPINPYPIKDYRENIIQQEVARGMPSNTKVFVAKTENFHSELDDDDDLFLDIDMSAAVQNQLSLTNLDENNLFNSSVIPNSQPEIIPNRRKPSTSEVPVVNEYENIMNDDDDDWLLAVSQEQLTNDRTEPSVNDDFEMTNISDNLGEIFPLEVVGNKSYLGTNYPFKIDNCNLVVISQLKECSNEELCGKKFVVFCKIFSVTDKLGIKFKKWKIGVLLTDGHEKLLLVKFDNNVMEDVIGHTTLEMDTMRNLIPEKPTISEEIMRIISNFKETLKKMHCFMKISFNDPGAPYVVKLIEPTRVYNTILERKLAHEK